MIAEFWGFPSHLVPDSLHPSLGPLCIVPISLQICFLKQTGAETGRRTSGPSTGAQPQERNRKSSRMMSRGSSREPGSQKPEAPTARWAEELLGLAQDRSRRLGSTEAVRLGKWDLLRRPPFPRPPVSAPTSASVTHSGPPPRLPGTPCAVSLATGYCSRSDFPARPAPSPWQQPPTHLSGAP